MPNALQSFALASGLPQVSISPDHRLSSNNHQSIPYYAKSWPWPSRKAHNKTLNSEKISIWLPGRECIWKQHGVWSIKNGEPVAEKPDYFKVHPVTGKPVNFDQDCYLPFILRYTEAIQSADKELVVLFEPIPNEDPPIVGHDVYKNKIVYAPHWYDLKALFTKVFPLFLKRASHALVIQWIYYTRCARFVKRHKECFGRNVLWYRWCAKKLSRPDQEHRCYR